MIKFFFLTMNILTFYLFNFFFEKSTPNIFKQKWANFSRGRRKIMNVRTLRRALCAKGLAETTTTSAGFSTAAMALKSKCTFLNSLFYPRVLKFLTPRKLTLKYSTSPPAATSPTFCGCWWCTYLEKCSMNFKFHLSSFDNFIVWKGYT